MESQCTWLKKYHGDATTVSHTKVKLCYKTDATEHKVFTGKLAAKCAIV